MTYTMSSILLNDLHFVLFSTRPFHNPHFEVRIIINPWIKVTVRRSAYHDGTEYDPRDGKGEVKDIVNKQDLECSSLWCVTVYTVIELSLKLFCLESTLSLYVFLLSSRRCIVN